MHRMLVVLGALLLAGCAEAPAPDGPAGDAPAGRATLGGTFTQERTSATLDAWCAVAREHGNECVLMESFPEQFNMGFATFADCEQARAKLLAIEHVLPGDCRAQSPPTGDPNEPTSSGPLAVDGEWRLHGSFLTGYTRDDIDAWCAIATELGQTCALMKSEPPQFQWSFAEGACEDARARLQGIDALRADACTAARSSTP